MLPNHPGDLLAYDITDFSGGPTPLLHSYRVQCARIGCSMENYTLEQMRPEELVGCKYHGR